MNAPRRSRANRSIFAILEEAGLKSRDDRLMLASSLLDKDVHSFTDLDDSDMKDLALALRDWRRVEFARHQTGALTIASIQHLANIGVSSEFKDALSDLCESIGLRITWEDEDVQSITQEETQQQKDERQI